MEFSKVKLQLVKEKDFDYDIQKLSSTSSTVQYLNEIEQLDKSAEERFFVVCLDIKNRIVAYSEIAKGGTDICPFDMKTIFKVALSCNSSKIIVAHNHPSGIAEPSKYDFDTTEKIRQACEIMNVTLLDHIVIGEDSYASCLI